MTELEIMEHARTYLQKLAAGENPLTGQMVPEGELLRNERIARCLAYVSEVLGKVIEIGGIPDGKTARRTRQEKTPFRISEEALRRYQTEAEPVKLGNIVQQLNTLSGSDQMMQLKSGSITEFLADEGLVQPERTQIGTYTWSVTDKGKALGIAERFSDGPRGGYTYLAYNVHAQQYLLEHMDEIVRINEQMPENQGKKWMDQDDAYLRRAYAANTDPVEMSRYLRRTRSAVTGRINALIQKRNSERNSGKESEEGHALGNHSEETDCRK
jgi:hypothetical protein